jgi:hypothetical protein
MEVFLLIRLSNRVWRPPGREMNEKKRKPRRSRERSGGAGTEKRP